MTAPYSIKRSREADRDLRSILRFLIQGHMSFGASFEEAKERATVRVREIRAAMNALATLPHQGTLRPKLMHGMRSVTKDRAIFYFTVDDEQRIVRVLAVFFGGQDHQRRMLRRLSRREKP